MLKRRFAEGVWAHWGLLLSAFALGGVLILATWSNYQGARDATHALHLGESRIFEREVMGALMRAEGPGRVAATSEVLDSLLTRLEPEGLRYVALLDAGGEVTAAAGVALDRSSAGPPDPREGPGPMMTAVGPRVRLAYFRPTMPRFPGAAPSARPTPVDQPPLERDRSRERGHGGIVFEFEPLTAMHLVERAGRLRAFGAAAAGLMMIVAAVSWMMSRRYERAKRRLEQERRLSLLGEMTAVLAHEIRNPLASLKGHAQLLAEQLPAGGGERGKADRVVHEAVRLEALTTDLLDFVRSGPLDPQPLDPAALVRQAAEEVESGGFDLDLEDAPARWSLDGPRLHQALTNLLRNARQATPAGARRPAVSLKVADRRLIIAIRDFGDGLPKGKEERVFDPFFTTRASGTGLGLAVARRIVDLHEGELAASTHPEGGAVFRMILPGERG